MSTLDQNEQRQLEGIALATRRGACLRRHAAATAEPSGAPGHAVAVVDEEGTSRT